MKTGVPHCPPEPTWGMPLKKNSLALSPHKRSSPTSQYSCPLPRKTTTSPTIVHTSRTLTSCLDSALAPRSLSRTLICLRTTRREMSETPTTRATGRTLLTVTVLAKVSLSSRIQCNTLFFNTFGCNFPKVHKCQSIIHYLLLDVFVHKIQIGSSQSLVHYLSVSWEWLKCCFLSEKCPPELSPIAVAHRPRSKKKPPRDGQLRRELHGQAGRTQPILQIEAFSERLGFIAALLTVQLYAGLLPHPAPPPDEDSLKLLADVLGHSRTDSSDRRDGSDLSTLQKRAGHLSPSQRGPAKWSSQGVYCIILTL